MSDAFQKLQLDRWQSLAPAVPSPSNMNKLQSNKLAGRSALAVPSPTIPAPRLPAVHVNTNPTLDGLTSDMNFNQDMFNQIMPGTNDLQDTIHFSFANDGKAAKNLMSLRKSSTETEVEMEVEEPGEEHDLSAVAGEDAVVRKAHEAFFSAGQAQEVTQEDLLDQVVDEEQSQDVVTIEDAVITQDAAATTEDEEVQAEEQIGTNQIQAVEVQQVEKPQSNLFSWFPFFVGDAEQPAQLEPQPKPEPTKTGKLLDAWLDRKVLKSEYYAGKGPEEEVAAMADSLYKELKALDKN